MLPGLRRAAALLVGAAGVATWWIRSAPREMAHLGDPVATLRATWSADGFLVAALLAAAALALVARCLRPPDAALAAPGLAAVAPALDAVSFHTTAGILLALGCALGGLAALVGRQRAGLATVPRARLVALAAIVVPAALVVGWPGPSGDEPHYLVVAHSLATDGELHVGDEYADGDFRPFHAGPLSPHYKPGRREGSRYSMHGVGLPLLLLPAYVAGRGLGPDVSVGLARLTLVLLYGLFALLLTRLSREIVGPTAATVGTLALVLTAPLLFASLHLFPEVPAMLVAVMVYGLLRAPSSARSLVGAAAGLAVLPFLGVKYLALAVGLVAAGAVHGWGRGARPRLLAGAAGLGAGLAGHAVYTWLLYGSLSPMAVYLGSPTAAAPPPALGGDLDAYVAAWPAAAATAVGYLLDQKEGLFLYGPHLLLALPGLPWLARHRRRDLAALGLVAGAHVGAYALSQQLGGQGPPVRPLMAVLWVLAPALGLGLTRPAGRALDALRGGALALAAALTVFLASRPTLLPHDYPVTRSRWIDALAPRGVEAWRAFPQWVNVEVPNVGVTAAWSLTVAGLVAAGLWVGGRAARQEVGAAARASTAAVARAAAVVSCLLAGLLLVRARVPLSARHEATTLDAGLTAWVAAALPELAWPESAGVWVPPGEPVHIVLTSPEPLRTVDLRLLTLVPAEVEVVLQGARLRGSSRPGFPVAGRLRPGRGAPLAGGGWAYHCLLRAGAGEAPSRLGDSDDERPLGVFLQLDAVDPVPRSAATIRPRRRLRVSGHVRPAGPAPGQADGPPGGRREADAGVHERYVEEADPAQRRRHGPPGVRSRTPVRDAGQT